MDWLSSVKPQILDLARKDCTALWPRKRREWARLPTSFFDLCPFRTSRAIGALFVLLLFFIGRFGWTSPFFPNSNGKGCLTSRCRFVFCPQWDGELVTPYLFRVWPWIFLNRGPARVVPTTGGEHLSIRSRAVTGSPILLHLRPTSIHQTKVHLV